MARWFARRWVWAAVAGAGMTAAVATGRADNAPPKVGTVITLNIDGKGDRSFKVVKSDKQADGTYLSELKDTKSGEVITLVDKPGDAPPPVAPASKALPPTPDSPKVPDAPKDNGLPKAKVRANDPLLPSAAAALPDLPKEKEKDAKRPVLGRIFGDKDKPAAATEMPAMPAAAAPTPDKKPGLFSRVFGPKKPTGPAMPAATSAPALKSPPSAPPAVIPTPPGGVSGTAEPPRVMPAKPATIPVAPPVAAPTPVTPSIPSIPTPLPPASGPVPIPVPLPAPPSIPVPLPAPPVPIPVPPGGTSSTAPVQQVVVPAGFLPVGVAFDRDVQPFVIALQTMDAPSARLTAAKALAEGRHCSTDGVKGVLFQAAQLDPCAEVRAECIGHLCKLGYFSPQFLGFIQTACEDTSPAVRDAAKAACAKMVRK